MTSPHLMLVHGAWHGAWSWASLSPLLDRPWHAPNMPGRLHEAPKVYRSLTLDDYAQSLCQKLSTIPGQVILLGHSFAGLTITQVAQMMPEKIQGLIYLSAFIPQSGQSMFDLTEPYQAQGLAPHMQIDLRQNKITLAPCSQTKALLYGQCAPSLQQQAFDNLCPEPLKPFASKVIYSNSLANLPKVYIKALHDQVILPNWQDTMIKNGSITDVLELKSDHSPFLSQPQKCAQAIHSALLCIELNKRPL